MEKLKDLGVVMIFVTVIATAMVCVVLSYSKNEEPSYWKAFDYRVVDVYETCEDDEIPRSFQRSQYTVEEGMLRIWTCPVGQKRTRNLCTFTIGQWCRVEERRIE